MLPEDIVNNSQMSIMGSWAQINKNGQHKNSVILLLIEKTCFTRLPVLNNTTMYYSG